MVNELAKLPSDWLWVVEEEAEHERTKWQIDAAESDLDEALCSFLCSLFTGVPCRFGPFEEPSPGSQ